MSFSLPLLLPSLSISVFNTLADHQEGGGIRETRNRKEGGGRIAEARVLILTLALFFHNLPPSQPFSFFLRNGVKSNRSQHSTLPWDVVRIVNKFSLLSTEYHISMVRYLNF
eukprot:TRINITY_DN14644_c0_g1_i1.p1 TRINITY_DN14644_c0_g1~~TRINITY_DN14644_c0_g1_i1.p1  ORF type:complete len:112 (-),score=17.85 TRINITY_DN14644_c0_g1_i1:202-537(-)